MRGRAELDANPLEDLETARAILEAKLVGKPMQPDEQVAESVVNAMSLIAGEYQSDSEEEGEVDHDDLKQTFIDEKIKELAEQTEKKKPSSASSETGDDVQIVGFENGTDDKDVEFISESLPPSKKDKVKEKDRKGKKSKDKSPKRSTSRDRKRSRSKSPPKKRRSLSPKQVKSPKRAKRSRSRDREKENKSPKTDKPSKTSSIKDDRHRESSRGWEREGSRPTRRSPRYKFHLLKY